MKKKNPWKLRHGKVIGGMEGLMLNLGGGIISILTQGARKRFVLGSRGCFQTISNNDLLFSL